MSKVNRDLLLVVIAWLLIWIWCCTRAAGQCGPSGCPGGSPCPPSVRGGLQIGGWQQIEAPAGGVRGGLQIGGVKIINQGPPTAEPQVVAPAFVRVLSTVGNRTGQGSGTIFYADGTRAAVVTCAHGSGPGATEVVRVTGRGDYPARQIWIDPRADSCVLVIADPGVRHVLAAREAPQVNAVVYAGGFCARDGRFRWSKGVVLGYSSDGMLRYSARVEEGQSGGPVLDAAGKLVGTVTGYNPQDRADNIGGNMLGANAALAAYLNSLPGSTGGGAPVSHPPAPPPVPAGELPGPVTEPAPGLPIPGQPTPPPPTPAPVGSDQWNELRKDIAALRAEMRGLALTPGPAGPPGPAGKDGLPGPAGPAGADGKDADCGPLLARIAALEARKPEPIFVERFNTQTGQTVKTAVYPGDTIRFREYPETISPQK